VLITRGSLTTFSIANDVAKYFAIIPAAFATTYPQLAVGRDAIDEPEFGDYVRRYFQRLDHRAADPLALKGVKYRALGAAAAAAQESTGLRYWLASIAVPFAGIKLIDMGLAALRLV